MTTYEEWRVTGTDGRGPIDKEFQHEAGARALVARGRRLGWTDGPHLHKRTVTVSGWEPA